ncbi:PIR Superfamily Protein [Plasmodium ovale curtisi]|uniref:PIR Superfamily Protein n=1 Tax=Plasmodium ovale curtisi TaxID=864141 RepID=A0A1A8XAF1_PLAOA|nr:PIR Superfamily Protein [Plasmodium ovale curtisi]SBT02237.1 PIR Superfamily Protein [Plasmodium ovale curtisi]
MAKILRNEDLERLPSLKHYAKLNNCGDYCFVSTTEFSSQLKQYIKSEPNITKILNVICDTSFKNKGDDCTERCQYLFFWLGEILFGEFEDAKKFPQIINVLDSLFKRESSSSKCSCNFSYEDINKDHFNDIKSAYFYFKDYTELQQKINFYKKSCDNDYKTYVDNSSKKYSNVYDTCEKGSDVHCTLLKKLVPNFLGGKLSTLSCDVVDGDIELEDPEEADDMLEEDSEFLKEENAITSAILTSILLPLLGIVFFLLYKFTPFGWWIRSYLIRNKIIQRNVHEEASVDLFSAVYETADEDSFMKKTLIGYHPSGNTS